MTLRLAGEADKPLLRAMLVPYLAEISGASAEGYPYFDDYWQEPGRRWPWLIGPRAAPQGFALTRLLETEGADGGPVRQLAEFYVCPEARRTGIGTAAAAALLRRGPGLWQVGILSGNAAARRFWPAAISAAGGEMLEQTHGREGVIRLHLRMPA
ncbi:MAG: GNAT family N-acetyltransferase [Rhodobacteraceae bacterium]|nr:GNAT family N-acetyltransferase [Paracoccaceae bacterium]MBR9819407.1 GNAT family N-acetyltransferase [Paracoccaceae bacterium]